MPAKRGRRPHHCVYIVELSKEVLDEPRFRKANPTYRLGFPCVYVGMTGLSPDVRLDKHKAGIQSRHGSGARHRPARERLRGLAGMTA